MTSENKERARSNEEIGQAAFTTFNQIIDDLEQLKLDDPEAVLAIHKTLRNSENIRPDLLLMYNGKVLQRHNENIRLFESTWTNANANNKRFLCKDTTNILSATGKLKIEINSYILESYDGETIDEYDKNKFYPSATNDDYVKLGLFSDNLKSTYYYLKDCFTNSPFQKAEQI